jgi:hypothetical protein
MDDTIFFVRNYVNEELLLGIEDGGVSEGGVANFVEGI